MWFSCIFTLKIQVGQITVGWPFAAFRIVQKNCYFTIIGGHRPIQPPVNDACGPVDVLCMSVRSVCGARDGLWTQLGECPQQPLKLYLHGNHVGDECRYFARLSTQLVFQI